MKVGWAWTPRGVDGAGEGFKCFHYECSDNYSTVSACVLPKKGLNAIRVINNHVFVRISNLEN